MSSHNNNQKQASRADDRPTQQKADVSAWLERHWDDPKAATTIKMIEAAIADYAAISEECSPENVACIAEETQRRA